MEQETKVRCPECACFDGWHFVSCNSATPLERIAVLERALKNANEIAKLNLHALDYQRRQVALWQGKHAILRHENNQLRKKLHRRATPTPEVPNE